MARQDETQMPNGLGRIGKYGVVTEIGKGGFATVCRALDTALEREIAHKVLDPLLSHDPVWISRFRTRLRALTRGQNLPLRQYADEFETIS